MGRDPQGVDVGAARIMHSIGLRVRLSVGCGHVSKRGALGAAGKAATAVQ